MIDKNKFGQELLGKIKQQNITPTPKWHFLLKDYVVWFLGFLSLIIGGLAFSVIIFLLRYNDWDIYEQLGESFLGFTLLTMPYFWIIFLILFMYIVLYDIKHTKKGYRYSLPLVLVVNIVASMILGALFYGVGIGRALDDVLGEKAPFYSKILNPRMGYWSKADEGRLSGIVVDIWNDEKFILLDFEKKEWQVGHDGISEVEIKFGLPLRVIGEKISEEIFEAERILPPGMPGEGLFRKHRNMRFPGPADRMKLKSFLMDNSEFKSDENIPPEILKEYPNLGEGIDDIRNEKFNIGGNCGNDKDCKLPFVYAIRSNCPFEVKCIEEKCRVVCEESYLTKNDETINSLLCETKEDCDCKFYEAEDKKDCICLNGICGAIVE